MNIIKKLFKKKDYDFDYYYLLKLEKDKLEKMVISWNNANYIGCEKHQRQMKLCINLIDIVLDDIFEYDGYINTKNSKRFWRYSCDNEKLQRSFELKIRELKALSLYNKIRNDNMLQWWW